MRHLYGPVMPLRQSSFVVAAVVRGGSSSLSAAIMLMESAAHGEVDVKDIMLSAANQGTNPMAA